MYHIDRDYPLPEPRRNLYPFRDMTPGDSFMVPNKPGEDTCANRCRVRSAIRKHVCRHPGFKAAIRKVPGGVRVWRTQ